jgi:hypothetical protein
MPEPVAALPHPLRKGFAFPAPSEIEGYACLVTEA